MDADVAPEDPAWAEQSRFQGELHGLFTLLFSVLYCRKSKYNCSNNCNYDPKSFVSSYFYMYLFQEAEFLNWINQIVSFSDADSMIELNSESAFEKPRE